MFQELTNQHIQPRRNPYESARRLLKVQALVDLLDRYGWGYDLDLVERMGDPHWEVVTGLARISTGQNFTMPSEKTRKMVIERVRTRIERAMAAA